MQGIRFCTIRVLTVLLFLAVAQSPLMAQQPAGRVLFVEGPVMVVNPAGERRGVERGSPVHAEDRILTSPEARIQVRLDDGSMLSLKGGSEYLIEAQRYDEADESFSAQAGQLFRGAMRKITGAIAGQESRNASQATPTATIGIRGTVFQVIHVPDEGLEQFPDLDSGTYFLLEEGLAEIYSDAGSAWVEAGELYYVAHRGAVPVRMPERMDLFELGFGVPVDEEDEEALLAGLLGDGDDEQNERDETAEAIGSTTEQQVRARLEEQAPARPFENVQALSGSYIDSGEGPQRRQRQLDQDDEFTDLFFSGEGSSRRMTGWRIEGDGFVGITADEGATPETSGYHPVVDQDGDVASEIIWGRWAQDDYTYQSFLGELSPWHYLAASDVIDEGQASGLAGSFRFGHVGDSGLSSPDGTRMELQGGHVDVDFGRAEMDILLDLAAGGDDFQLSGLGSFADFHGTFVGLESQDNWEGRFSGAFSGSGGEGLLANLLVFEEGGNPNVSGYVGTAAFQNTFERTFTNVRALSTHFSDGEAPVLRNRVVDENDFGRTLFLEGSGTNRVLTGWSIEDSGSSSISTLDGASPEEGTTGYHAVRNDADQVVSEIVWGRWAQDDYDAEYVDNPEDSLGPWHYMAASNALPSAEFDALLDDGVLTGQFSYNLAGTTDLTGDNVAPMRINPDSALFMDFATRDLQVMLRTTWDPEGDAQDYTLRDTGFNEVGDLYAGVSLMSDDEFWGGSMEGAFSGQEAEGLFTFLNLSNASGDELTGTAAFQQNEVLEGTGLGVALECVECPDNTAPRQASAPFPPGFQSGTQISGEDAQRRVEVISEMDGLDMVVFEAVEGADPVADSMGYHQFTDEAGETVAEANWGVWSQGDYTLEAGNLDAGNVEERDTTGPWHYMLATDTDMRFELAGEFTFDYVGGTGLTNGSGGTLAFTQDSALTLDFTTEEVDVLLGVEGDFQDTLTGAGQLGDLFGNGVDLSGEALIDGIISGEAAGPELEGIVSRIAAVDDLDVNWVGTAAFER